MLDLRRSFVLTPPGVGNVSGLKWAGSEREWGKLFGVQMAGWLGLLPTKTKLRPIAAV
jgi:hypothetical protein